MLAVLLLVLGGCTPAPMPELKVGTNIWPGYEPFYLARSLGLLDGSGIKLIEHPSSTEVLRGMRDRTLDAAALTLDEALTLLQDDPGLRVVLVMDVSAGADAVVARAGLEAADLKGRRVGAETSAVGAYMMARFLELSHLSAKDIELVSLTMDEHERAFRDGRVDALVTFEPVLSRLREYGAHVLFDSSRIPGEIVDVLVIREPLLRKRQRAVRMLIRQWFAALAYLHDHPPGAAALMQGRLGLDADRVLALLDEVYFPDVHDNRQLLAGRRLKQTSQRLAEIMLEHGLLRRHVDPGALLTAAMLPEGRAP